MGHSMAVAEKPRTARLRVCLNPKDLIKTIKRPHYPLPTHNDIKAKLAVVLWMPDYWAIQLAEKLSKRSMLNTVFGRYRCLCLPFGPISVEDKFQQRVDKTYEGL